MSQLDRTVLIVDDSPVERETYRQYLLQETDFAYTLWEAESATPALQLCDRQLPDGIVLNYLLPDMDGLEFLAQLQHRFNPCPPVVMLAGREDATVAVRAIKTGAEDYLAKQNLTPAELRLAVKSAIANAELRHKIQQYDRQFRTSVENMLDCFGIYSAIRDDTGQIIDFRFDYLNAAALESNCMSGADIGKRLCEVFPAHHESGLLAEYSQVVETGQPLVKEALEYSDTFGTQHLTRAYDIRASKLHDGLVLSWRDITDRKRTELERDRYLLEAQQARQQAEASEQRYRAIVEDQTELICRFLPDGTLTFVNQAYCRYFGLIPATAIGQNILNFIPPNDRSFVEQQIRELATLTVENSTLVQEHQVVKSNGEIAWQQWHNRAIFNDRGQLVEFQAVGRDITDRVRSESNLKQSEAQLQLAMQSAKMGFWDLNLITKNAVWSPEAKKLLGLPIDWEQCNYETLKRRTHPDDRALLDRAISESLDKGFHEIEFRVVWDDGSIHWLTNKGHIFDGETDRTLHLVGMSTDISDRKQAEEGIQQSEQNLQLAVKIAKLGYWQLDLTTYELYSSDQCKANFGLPPEANLTYQQLFELTHPDDRDRVRELISSAIENRSDYAAEYRNIWPDGSIHWLSARGNCCYDRDGTPLSMSGVTTDISDRKITELALQQANDRFELAAAAVNSIIYDWDLKTDTVDRTRGLYEVTGYLVEESDPSSKWWLDLIHPDDRPNNNLEQELGELVQFDRRVTEYRVRHKNGYYIWVEDWARTIPDDRGQPLRIVGNTRDISARKLAEQSLRESEERLLLGMQVAGVGLAKFDYASNTVTLSPQAAALYGLPAGELTVTRDRIHATFHPEERAELAQIIQQVLDPAGAGWFARDHRVVWENGEVRWLTVRKQVFFDRSGELPHPNYAILAAIDITDRKQAESNLRESEERFQQLANSVPHLFWISEPMQQRLIYASPAYEKIWGRPLAEVYADYRQWMDTIHPDDRDRVAAHFAETIVRGDYNIEYRILRPDGSIRWICDRGFPIQEGSGEVRRAAGIAEDITDRKQWEQERERLLAQAQAAREAAEAANRSKDEFIAIVAHELRSPLNSVMGWAQMLQKRTFDAATTAKALATIVRNTQAQVQLIDDLLDISRMIRGKLNLTLQPVNSISAIEAALEVMRPMAAAKQIQLRTRIQAVGRISGDLNRLQQIAINLLTNAIKFTPVGGRVEVVLEESDTQVCLQVCDTGKGIVPEFLPYIFERFQQAQTSTGAKDGLGLGLAIVKHLVELHGGTIAAASPGAGQGSTFTVMLPLLEVEGGRRDDRSDLSLNASSLPLAGIRILAVDDEPDSLEMLRFTLEEFGGTVASATTAIAVLELLPQFQPDILLCDIAMPEMNGYDLLRQIRLLKTGQIPAIAVTAYASLADREKSLQAGFQHHFSKPVEPESLVAEIVKIIRS